MKLLKRSMALFIALMMLTADLTVCKADDLDIQTPSAILMEATTGTVIYEKNADEKLHPASITKIMTLILIFDALDSGKINKEEQVTVSEYAASMGGSQVFLEANEIQTVDTMIKCISVASANDACVAMAEFISGSENAFVDKMNEKAKELGMNNTTFENCCGLDSEGHLSSARDVALMSRYLINNYPEIHNYSTIWMDTITHETRKGQSEFGLSNTNKLIKQYQYATGLKTGSTGLAKCCLSATAKKDEVNLIAVIMAAPNSKTRFADATSLLNYGFSKCSVYSDENMPELQAVDIKGGVVNRVYPQYNGKFSYMFAEDYDVDKIKKDVRFNELTAPVMEGEKIGEIEYYYDNEKIGAVDIISANEVRKAEFIDILKQLLNRITIAE